MLGWMTADHFRTLCAPLCCLLPDASTNAGVSGREEDAWQESFAASRFPELRDQAWDSGAGAADAYKASWLSDSEDGQAFIGDDLEEREAKFGWLSRSILNAVAMACMTLEMQGEADFWARPLACPFLPTKFLFSKIANVCWFSVH